MAIEVGVQFDPAEAWVQAEPEFMVASPLSGHAVQVVLAVVVAAALRRAGACAATCW